MPCSRSARRPSVSSDRSVYSVPRSREVRSTASSWSSKIALESKSSRPIRVDFPSSTLPAVAKRRMSIRTALQRSYGFRGKTASEGALGSHAAGLPWRTAGAVEDHALEVALPLTVFHRGLGGSVVGAGGTALGDPGGRDLIDDLLDRRGGGLDGT